jgi:hypothetical protein
MLAPGLSHARLVEHLFFRNCIAGGIHADLFRTVFSGVIPSIGLSNSLYYIQLQLKRMPLSRALDDIRGSIDGKRSV